MSAILDRPYLLKRELAQKLNVCPATINNYMNRGMPHLRLGHRTLRFFAEDVEAWFNSQQKAQHHAS